MKVLITGGTSKIGRKLINHLINQNLSIRTLKRRDEFTFSNRVESVIGDLLNSDSLLKAVQGVDLIVHLAAVTHTNNRKTYWQINVKGTENLIKAVKSAGISRFIFVSTRAIHPSGGPYNQSKLAAEKIIKNSGINWLILRPAEVYGIGQKGMIEQLIKLIRRFYLIPVIKCNNCHLAPIYIDDLIDILEKVILHSNFINKTYILAGPDNLSFEKFVNQICHFFNLRRLKVYLPVLLIKLASKLFSLLPKNFPFTCDQIDRLLSPKSSDISLAKKDLGFRPISFQRGLILLDKRYKENK